jgi:hypothetical protein
VLALGANGKDVKLVNLRQEKAWTDPRMCGYSANFNAAARLAHDGRGAWQKVARMVSMHNAHTSTQTSGAVGVSPSGSTNTFKMFHHMCGFGFCPIFLSSPGHSPCDKLGE